MKTQNMCCRQYPSSATPTSTDLSILRLLKNSESCKYWGMINGNRTESSGKGSPISNWEIMMRGYVFWKMNSIQSTIRTEIYMQRSMHFSGSSTVPGESGM